MRIISQNDFDTCFLTSSPVCVSTMPASNMQTIERGSVARVVPVAPWSIYGVFNPGNRTISSFVISRHNITGAGTARLRLFSSSDATTGVLYDSTALIIGSSQTWGNFQWGVDPWQSNGYAGWSTNYYVFWFAATSGVNSFRLDISDPTNADGYLEIGRCYCGQYWQPEKSASKAGFTMEWKELSTQTRTGNSGLKTEGYMPFRSFTFNMASLSELDRANFAALARHVGLRTDFFISFYPGAGGAKERDYSASCKFTSLPKISPVVDSVNLSSGSATMEEI